MSKELMRADQMHWVPLKYSFHLLKFLKDWKDRFQDQYRSQFLTYLLKLQFEDVEGESKINAIIADTLDKDHAQSMPYCYLLSY